MKNLNYLFGKNLGDLSQTNKTASSDYAVGLASKITYSLIFAFGFLFSNAQFGGDTIVCANTPIIYTLPAGPGYVYTWNAFGAAQFTQNSNTFVVTWGPPTPSGGGLITAVVQNSLGATVYTAALNVTVNPLPEPKIQPVNANGCSYNILSSPDGTTTVPTAEDSTDVCYIVCDSSIFEYKVAIPFSGHTYTWKTIPLSASIGQTITSLGHVLIKWSAPANQVTLRLYETDSITGCQDSVDACIRIIARPNASFATYPAATGTIVNVCLNATVAFFDLSTGDANSSIASWHWDFGDGIASLLQSPAHTYTASGSHIVKLVVENQCHCRDSMMVKINVQSQPGPDINCVSPLCFNSTDTYCTTYSCTSYQWSVTNGTITNGAGTSCIDVAWGTNGPGSIVLLDTCAGSCAFPTSVLIPILTPTTTISGPNLACENSTGFYSVPNVPATTYSWSVAPSGTIMSSQGSNATSIFWGAATTVCTVKVVYTNLFLGCSGTAVYVVTVTPKLQITGDAVLCDLSTGNYSSNSSNCTWTVKDPNGAISTPFVGSAFAYNFNGPGAYVVYAKDNTFGFCSSPAAFQVQIVAKPPQPIASLNNSICPGQTYLYTAAPLNNNYFLKWVVSGGIPNQTSGNAISVTWSLTGPWSISLTQTGVLPPSCESDPLIINMVNPSPPTPTVVGTSTTCYNQSVNFATSSVADDYEWVISPTSLASIVSGNHTQNITVQINNGTSPAILTVGLKITVCTQTSVAIYTVLVTPPATPTITVPANICEGQSAQFSTSSTGSSYLWDFGDTGTGTGNPSNHTYTSVLPYIVSLTVTNVSNCGISLVTSTIINVKPTPIAFVTSPNQLTGTCGGGAFTHTLFAAAQTITGTPSYTWSPISSSTNVATTSQTGVHSMTVMINGCSASTSFAVDTLCPAGSGSACVYVNPSGNTVNLSYTLNCLNASFTPTITGTGGTLLSWLFGTATGSSTATNPNYNYPTSGYYHVKLTAGWPAVGGGMCYQQDTMTVAVPIAPDFKYDFACGTPDLNVQFVDQSNWIPGTTVGYSWLVVPGPLTSTAQNPTWNLAGGNYTTQLTITGGGQTCSITKTLTVPQRPTPGFTVPTSVCEGNPITFTSTSAPSGAINIYHWVFDDGSTLVTQNSLPNGVRTYAYLGSNYNPSLTITDVYGCSTTTTSSIFVNQNLFTLNNVAVTPTSAIICQGDSAQICSISLGTANPNTPFSYFWTNFEATGCIYAKQPGIYGVIVTDVYGCKSVKKNASVNVIYVPSPLIAGNQSYCLSETPLMSIDRGPGYDYQWAYTIGSSSSTTTSACNSALWPAPNPPCSIMTPSLSSGFTGTIELQGIITETTSGLNCREVGPLVTLTIHPLPTPPSVGPNACESPYPINLVSGGGPVGTSNIWNTGASGNIISVTNAGKYWASIVDQFGCKSIADTAYVNPNPDFNPLIFGCYDICDTGQTVIPVPPGYAEYTWVKEGVGVVDGPSVTPIALTFSNPSFYAGGNSGVYKLILKTDSNCVDSSKTITINEIPCITCTLGLNVYTINCVQDDDGNILYYDWTFGVTYSGTVAANYTMATSSGTISALSPTPYVLNPGLTDLDGVLIPSPGATHFCFSFTVQPPAGDDALPCVWDTCILLPPCGPPPCALESINLDIDCNGLDANGDPVYKWNLNYIYPYAGTVIVSSNEGPISPTGGFASPGSNGLIGSFTDTPIYDGVLCIDLYIYSEETGWCHEQICKELPQVDPCYQEPPPCELDVQVDAMICYTLNAAGQPVYNMTLNINNPTANTYSYYLLSQQGILGAMSPPYIDPGFAAYTGTMQQTLPFLPGSTICFTLIATDTITGDRCESLFCFKPEVCDGSYFRLISTTSILLYPNPAVNQTIAEYKMEKNTAVNKLQVIDLSGRTVLEQILPDQQGKVTLDTSQLPAGMYFVKALHDNFCVLTEKLIIQR